MTTTPTSPPGFRDGIEAAAEEVSLAACPIGLFVFRGELCLKTEYGGNDGRIDAYIVSSGEFFWGGTVRAADQRNVMVLPAQVKALPTPDTLPAGWNSDMGAAPKDGTRILGYGKLGFESENGVGTVAWNTTYDVWHLAPNEATEYPPEDCHLTAWMPLPPSPRS